MGVGFQEVAKSKWRPLCGQKYECADLLTIPVTLTTRNAATASVQIQQQIQIQESTNRITEQIFES